MVTKGLDFDKVSLVGVFNADRMMHFPDFRSYERAYQLITQVSGRAGRKDRSGKVCIQATNTRHPLLQLIKEHDYKTFFDQEIDGRKRFFYPPFSRIILLTFKHKMKDVVDNAAMFFAAALKSKYGQYLVGPAEPVVNRIRNQFLMELLIKLPKDTTTVKGCKQFILDTLALMHNDKRFRSVVMIPDVDK